MLCSVVELLFACMGDMVACLEILGGGIELVGCEQGEYRRAYEGEPSELWSGYDD